MEKKETATKKIGQIFCLEGKRQAILPTNSHSKPLKFRGMAIFQTHIIQYRNKYVQIALLIFFHHEKL